jgi:O-antigen ligase
VRKAIPRSPRSSASRTPTRSQPTASSPEFTEPRLPIPEPPEPVQPGPPARRGRIVALFLIIGAVGIVLANVQSTVFDLERHQVPKAFILHLTALGCLLALLPTWRRIELDRTALLFAAFVLWSLLSALLATNRWLAFHAAGIGVSAFILFIAAQRVVREGFGSRVLAGLAAAAVLAGALGVAQAYGADWSWLTDSRPPGGTFGNRNFLAHLLAIAMPLLTLLLLRGRFTGAALAFLGLIIASGAIVLTRSRAAWLGAAAALFVMAGAALYARRSLGSAGAAARTFLMAAAVAAGAAGGIFLPNTLDWRSGSPYAETLTRITSYSEGSGRGRLIQYGNSLDLVARAPIFGVGPGNWFVHYPRVTSDGDPAFAGGDPIPTNPWPSSDWVAMLVERGILGVALLLATFASAAATALRHLRGDARVSLRCSALLGTLVATLVTGAFDAVLLLAAPAFYFAVLLGLLLPPSRGILTRDLRGPARTALVILALGATTLLVTATAGQIASIVIAGDGESRTSLHRAAYFDPGSHRLRLLLARRGPCSDRLPHAHAAERLMPHHDAPARALRACGAAPDR